MCTHDTLQLPLSHGWPLDFGAPQSQRSGQPSRSSEGLSGCARQPGEVVGLPSAFLPLPATLGGDHVGTNREHSADDLGCEEQHALLAPCSPALRELVRHALLPRSALLMRCTLFVRPVCRAPGPPRSLGTGFILAGGGSTAPGSGLAMLECHCHEEGGGAQPLLPDRGYPSAL